MRDKASDCLFNRQSLVENDHDRTFNRSAGALPGTKGRPEKGDSLLDDLTMQVEVEAFAFAIRVDPPTDDQIDDLQQDERDDRVVDDGAADTVELDDDLMRVAVDEAAMA